MRMRKRLMLWAMGLGLYATGVGFLGGVAVDRMLFDRERNAAVHRLEDASRRLHDVLIDVALGAGAR